jgi:biotin carboxyl carrier protein
MKMEAAITAPKLHRRRIAVSATAHVEDGDLLAVVTSTMR